MPPSLHGRDRQRQSPPQCHRGPESLPSPAFLPGLKKPPWAPQGAGFGLQVRPRQPSGSLQQACPAQRAGREGFSVAQHMVKILESDQKTQDEITAPPGIRYMTESYLTSNLASLSVWWG